MKPARSCFLISLADVIGRHGEVRGKLGGGGGGGGSGGGHREVLRIRGVMSLHLRRLRGLRSSIPVLSDN